MPSMCLSVKLVLSENKKIERNGILINWLNVAYMHILSNYSLGIGPGQGAVNDITVFSVTIESLYTNS